MLSGGDLVGGGGDPLGQTRVEQPQLDAFTRAAAPLIRPSQCTTATGIVSPETGKLSTALRVSPPQSSAIASLLASLFRSA